MGVVDFPHEIGARVRAVADQYGAVHATRGSTSPPRPVTPEVATAWVGVYWLSEVLTRRSSIRLTTKVTTSSVSRTVVPDLPRAPGRLRTDPACAVEPASLVDQRLGHQPSIRSPECSGRAACAG